MAAIDATSGRQFFHGTSSRLKPGDEIKPNYHSDDGSEKFAHRDFTWATTRQSDAEWYANHRAKATGVGDNTGEAHVYEVEHTGLAAPAPESSTAHISLAPLRVKREV